jgi:hypothetical protein
MPGKDCSPLGAIQTWIDILAAGVRPGSVRVLGVNGGESAGLEYRLALALGATVGLLGDSGGAATLMSADPEWQSHPGLVILPRDYDVVRSFIHLPPPAD